MTDLNGRLKFVFKPDENFTADLRLSADRLWTQAFYYNINYYNGLEFLGPPYSVLTTPDVNNTSLPVRVNNAGKDNREIYDASLKMDYDVETGTFTSISSYNLTKEILTGDAFDFLPNGQSLLDIFAGYDQNQSQFLRVRTLTQEFRFTSPRPTAGSAGSPAPRASPPSGHLHRQPVGHRGRRDPVYYEPTTPAPAFPRLHAQHQPAGDLPCPDGQSNFAWAAYLDTSTSITDQLELSLNVRFDRDHRKNTT